MDHKPSSPSGATIARIISGLSELAYGYDVLLCDVWGVLHNGESCFSQAAEALNRFRGQGGTVILITNAPRPNGPVREQMDRIGVPHSAYDGVVTSGDVTVASIVERGHAPVYHIGPQRDLALFDEVERLGGIVPPLRPVTEADYVVATGMFLEDTDTPADYDADLAVMRERGLPMICANPDLVVHVGQTLRYCAGAIAERYMSQGGTVIYAGKPHAPIYDAALKMAQAHQRKLVRKSRVLAIGDALRTDVAGAVLQGLDVLFITSGIHRDESHQTGDGRLDPRAYQDMIEAAEHRPLAAIASLAW
jgi:HAD superfamily hydrolase (TIGR01459 family)